jgi:DNA-binding NarL/FixJ family response regulator
MKRIAVLLMDARPAARQGLRAVLEAGRDVRVAGEAGDPDQAMRAARRQHPDVVVVGVGPPLQGGLAAARKILRGARSAKVLLLLVSHGPGAQPSAVSDPWESFRRVIEQAANPRTGARPGRTLRANPRTRRSARQAGWPTPAGKLTFREGQVLQGIANGLSNKQIAGNLELSIKTVEKHRQQMMDKLDIHGIAGLTRYAIRRGMLDAG